MMDAASMDFDSMDDVSIARFLRSHVHRPIPGNTISGPNPVAVAMKPVFLRLMEKRLTPKDSERYIVTILILLRLTGD